MVVTVLYKCLFCPCKYIAFTSRFVIYNQYSEVALPLQQLKKRRKRGEKGDMGKKG